MTERRHVSDGMWRRSAGSEKVPNKISERDVCRQIIDCREGLLREIRTCGGLRMCYSRRQFEDDMLVRNFISSAGTVRIKWRLLRLNGIVVEEDGATYVKIADLYIRAGMTVPIVGGRDRGETHTAEEGGQ